MAGNPWAAATSVGTTPTSNTNPWAAATAGGLADKLQVASASEHDEAGAAAYANSPTGLAAATVKEIGTNAWGAVTDAVTGLENTYGSVVPQIESAVSSGAADIAKGNSEDFRQGGGADIIKGFGKTILGTAGTVAGAVYAPIGAAIGAALQATGGQKLLDQGGQEIANTSGITDIPAFQKFAQAHPNAASYFNNAMNLVLGGADDGKILDASKQAAQAIVDSAGKPVETNPLVKLPVTGDTTPSRLPVTDQSPTETQVPIANDYRNAAPDIQTGPAAKDASGLPSIQAGEPSPTAKMGSLTVEPIEQPSNPAPAGNDTTTSAPSPSTAENGTVTPSVSNEDVATGGETPTTGNKVSGVADTIEATALRKQLLASIPEKAGYNSSDFNTQSKMVADFINNEGIDAARAAVKDETQMPKGIKSGALIQGLELYANKHPEVAGQIYREIAASHLTSTISEGASETSFARMIDRESPSMVIKDAIEKKAGGTEGTKKIAAEAKKAKSTITKAAAKMMDYQSIIDSIKTC